MKMFPPNPFINVFLVNLCVYVVRLQRQLCHLSRDEVVNIIKMNLGEFIIPQARL